MLMKFGKPISLKPYYARYQEAPRETMMEINKIVHGEIKEMMLHVEDLEHYDQIDFLRENTYGQKFARKRGFKFNYLPSRLLSDQKLVAELAEATKGNPEEMEAIYKDTAELTEGYKKLNVRDWLFNKKPHVMRPVLRGLGLLLLLPFFLVSAIPTGLLFLMPKIFLKKLIKDQMFVSSFNVAVSVFVTIPLCLILPVVLLWILIGFWWALGYFVAFPIMFVLVWNYMRMFRKFVGSCSYVRSRNRKEVKRLRLLRKSIFNRLDKILG
jgi:hypothetical protein